MSTLKDSGIYEFILEGASQKSIWYSDVNKNFEHFLVKGSPWMDSINLNTDECSRYLYLLKNFNYLLINKSDDNSYEAYLGNYELNDKGCFLFKKYSTTISSDQFITIDQSFNSSENKVNDKSYENLETYISSFISTYNFKLLDSNELLEYFEYTSSAFAAYGTRQIFLERFKSLLYSKINIDHNIYLKGAGSGENDIDLADISTNIIFDEAKAWVNSDDKSYEQRDY